MPRDSWRIIARDLVPPRSVFVFSDEEGSRGAMLDRGIRMEQGTLERFEILFPCPRKFDRVEGRLLSRERVEVDEI